jgi:hypothetical protein
VSGTRALGGPVRPNSLYEVSEGGNPELLAVGGRTYLMMGAQGGTVLPAMQAAGAAMGAGLAGLGRTAGQLADVAPLARQAQLAGAVPAVVPAGGGGSYSLTVAPVFNGLVVDNAQRLAEMKQAIVEAAQQANAQAFSRSVDGLILGRGAS